MKIQNKLLLHKNVPFSAYKDLPYWEFQELVEDWIEELEKKKKEREKQEKERKKEQKKMEQKYSKPKQPKMPNPSNWKPPKLPNR